MRSGVRATAPEHGLAFALFGGVFALPERPPQTVLGISAAQIGQIGFEQPPKDGARAADDRALMRTLVLLQQRAGVRSRASRGTVVQFRFKAAAAARKR